jgi:hypothetical protein
VFNRRSLAITGETGDTPEMQLLPQAGLAPTPAFASDVDFAVTDIEIQIRISIITIDDVRFNQCSKRSDMTKPLYIDIDAL